VHFFNKSVFFQLARGGFESAVYKKLIAPFKNDLPTSDSDGFRRVCADHKYAYFGSTVMKTKRSLTFPCQLVPLPETSYKVPWAFTLSKNSSYKGLINWRWDNKMKSIRYMTHNSRLWVPRKSPNTKTCLSIVRNKSFNNRNVLKFCKCYFLMEVIVNS